MANDLRGSVDGWDFKSYVLGMLFYRFISENLAAHINKLEREAGETDFEYAKLSDTEAELGREETVREKGFFILPSQLFCNVCRRADSDPNLNETLSTIFAAIENSAKGTESEPDFKGLFGDIDVNSNKLAPENIERIYQAHVARKDEQHFARLVPNAEVAENDYNLAVSSYVEQPDTREKIDIDELNERIVGIVERQAKLRAEIERLISQIA